MHKFSNLTGTARQGWEKVSPANFSMSRSGSGGGGSVGNNPSVDGSNVNGGVNVSGTTTAVPSPVSKRPAGAASAAQAGSTAAEAATDKTVNLSFNVPFATNLAGPEAEDILHASPGALDKWIHPEGTPEGTPTYKLPVHTQNIENLRQLCREIKYSAGPRILEAAVTASEAKQQPLVQAPSLRGLLTNVCLAGEADAVQRYRAKILNSTPVALKSAIVDIDNHLVIDASTDSVKSSVLEHLDTVAKFTGTDVFLLGPKPSDVDCAGSIFNGSSEMTLDQRLRVAIYGDMESVDHAKTRVLIMVDQILKRIVDVTRLELSMHNLICGRARKNIKLIESLTNTAIYLPPPFPGLYGYVPQKACRRGSNEIYITGESVDNIQQAESKLRELVLNTKARAKEVVVTSSKIDYIILDRLDKIRKIMESNGTFILFPQLGHRGRLLVQGTDALHIERTIRELMTLAGQFYNASWWILTPAPGSGVAMRAPTAADVRPMLSDICANSGADVTFEKLTFSINGSDDAVKAAMAVINQIPFVMRSQYQMRVKIELANEHKEFVSGKKNGKINKIMGQSNVQIIFDGFNEYNFYIDVCGSNFDATKNGLDLVEQEMPASISFHVPDQYHKRIIGIGGQHIQRIMKKYSVFVKFSNAMDRGRITREDDDIKVDNVICRTPARNAQNLDLVKSEIMDMVEKVDAEFVSESVVINRLYHRELIARMTELEELERKWNCKIVIPGTEVASDIVTISGPEYQVPQAVDEFLGMVPESHEIVLPSSDELRGFVESQEYRDDVQGRLKTQYEVDLQLSGTSDESDDTHPPRSSFLLTYTRNNAGGLKDAVDFFISRLVANGIDATTIKGAIPRPKSDSFEDNLPFFESKLLQHAPTPIATDSPTRSSFGKDDVSERSIFDRLRKPGSMASISSFLDRRKNQSRSPGSFFQNGSSCNGSKASLISVESTSSFSRHPWNDSAVNLPEDEHALHLTISNSHQHAPPSSSSHSHHSSNHSTGTRPSSRHLDQTKFAPGSASSSSHSAALSPGTAPGSGSVPGSGSASVGLGSLPGSGPGSGSATRTPGDVTPRYDRRSSDSRPSTSHSSGYPVPIGTPR